MTIRSLPRRRRSTLLSPAKHDASVHQAQALKLKFDLGPCYVNQLPLELLELVFHFAQELDPPHAYPGHMYAGWFRVLSVCSWWRSVAIQSRRLWDSVPGTDLPSSWVFRMVAYSQSAPLNLSLNTAKLARGLPDQSLSRLLDTVADRLRYLHLLIDGDEQDVVATLREAPAAPGLRSLSITANSAAILLPIDVFSHDTGALKKVTLVDCFVPWDAPVYDKLEHLSVHLTPHAAHSIGFAEVQDKACSQDAYEVLQRLAPTLKTLSLRNLQPFTSDSARGPIHFPELDHLTLEGSTSDCITIMHSLSLHPSANVSLYLSSDDPAALVNTIHILGIASIPVRALELDFDHESTYQFTMRLHHTIEDRERMYTMYVNRTAYSSRWVACYEYAPLVQALRLDETTTLIHRASNWRFWAAETWRSIHLPKLRVAQAVGIPASVSLLSAFAGTTSTLAPQLEYLRVARVPPGYAFFSHRPEVLSLEQFKKLREDAGCPVAEVVTV